MLIVNIDYVSANRVISACISYANSRCISLTAADFRILCAFLALRITVTHYPKWRATTSPRAVSWYVPVAGIFDPLSRGSVTCALIYIILPNIVNVLASTVGRPEFMAVRFAYRIHLRLIRRRSRVELHSAADFRAKVQPVCRRHASDFIRIYQHPTSQRTRPNSCRILTSRPSFLRAQHPEHRVSAFEPHRQRRVIVTTSPSIYVRLEGIYRKLRLSWRRMRN